MIADAEDSAYRMGAMTPPDIEMIIQRVMTRVRSVDALRYLCHGVERRLHMLDYCLQRIAHETPPAGSEPLTPDKAAMLAVYLNAFYINVRGTLDNLAWVLYHELKLNEERPSVTESKKQSIGLSSKSFLCALESKSSSWSKCASTLASDDKKNWFKTIADKRDPAAHRLPIEVPCGVVPPENKERYDRLRKEMEKAPVEDIYGLDCEAENCAHFDPYMFIEGAHGEGKVTWLFDELRSDANRLFDTVRIVLNCFAADQCPHPQKTAQ